ncbi:hypothetical protein D4741_19600 [Pseudoalteromonas gelatinilytica]|uniref:Uncharacterized protein n=1 Tax=Pseudoalteromonas gelatinilytica TaxID=1703256 RepID=A0A3A3EEB0_9GAMM|nr:hypothetical protein D4741_19600 [Pseudoalteromonas profundi]
MSPDCGLKTQIVLHSSCTKPRLKLQQRVNWVVGWVERSETQHRAISFQPSAISRAEEVLGAASPSGSL